MRAQPVLGIAIKCQTTSKSVPELLSIDVHFRWINVCSRVVRDLANSGASTLKVLRRLFSALSEIGQVGTQFDGFAHQMIGGTFYRT